MLVAGAVGSTRVRPVARTRVVLNALAEWCRERGAENLYLQVEEKNAAAQALHEGAGFRRLYNYHYRVLR